jgi:hypothetical protein
LYTLRSPVRGSHANPISFGESRFPQNYFVWQNLKIGSRPPNAPSWSHEAHPAAWGPWEALKPRWRQLGGRQVVGAARTLQRFAAYPATTAAYPVAVAATPAPGPRARGSAAVPAYPATTRCVPCNGRRVPCSGSRSPPTRCPEPKATLQRLRTLHR